MTGFRSATYFSKCFSDYFSYPPVEVTKQAFDITDLEYRKVGVASEESSVLMHNFPVQTTSFIGREKEIGAIISLIKKHRIVILTGTGGCGKTRLACEAVANLVKDYPDGIWFVDLAPVEAEEHVVKQLMTTLGLSEIPGREIMEIIIDRIRDKKLLILLDNCEHLLITCTIISFKLIESVPGLSLVATSREALNIDGEKVWRVPSLTLTDPAADIDVEQAVRSEVVRLFTDRAKLNNTGFELVEKNTSAVSAICHRVDGIPLAIELVASRTRYMDTMTMLDRLSERFENIPSLDPGTIARHKTIEATIEWSYNLLSEEEKTLFMRLSVFKGGFDLLAVEEVCAYEILPGEGILDLLSQLVDRSMIQTVYRPGQQMRYKLLETLLRYASNLLIEKGEGEETRKRHLEYFSGIADTAYEERISSQAKWIDELQKEHDNMLAALRWAEIHDTERFRWLAGSLSWFWARSSHYSTARKILEGIIAGNNGNKEALARAETGYGSLLTTGGDLERAKQLLIHGRSLWKELGNFKEETLSLAYIADAYFFTGKDDDLGVMYAKKALTKAQQLGDSSIELQCMASVAQGLVNLKKTREARPAALRLLAIAEELENPFGILAAHHLLGDCAIMEGQYIESEKEYGQGVFTSFKSGDASYTCVEMVGVAMSIAGQGRYAKALRLNAAATRIAKTHGFSVPEEFELIFWKELVQQHIAGTREKLGKVLTAKYEEEGRAFSLEKAVEHALDFEAD
jgi:predicted ATPase